MHIALVTSTRADWGILRPLACALDSHPDVRLTVLATNMHLLSQFGNTIDEVEDAGLSCVRRVPVEAPADDSPAARAVMMGSTMQAFATEFEILRPDEVILLGDRFEILAIACTAAVMTVPIVHLHGGEVSEGANDDSFRHAISKLASLHLAATDMSRSRLLAMGEMPDRVFSVGALGVGTAVDEPVMSLDELNATLGDFDIEPERTIMVTYHPVTLDPDGRDPDRQMDELLAAFDCRPDLKILMTYPNNDAGGAAIIRRIEDYASRNTGRVKVVPSLGRRRFLSALRYVRAMVGNSSSGILEAPSTRAVTIDIGTRQRGRERAASVISVPVETDAIVRALDKVMANPADTPTASNPYYRPYTLSRMVDIITTTDPATLNVKLFGDITSMAANSTITS